jgi:uncharacterized membrane protein
METTTPPADSRLYLVGHRVFLLGLLLKGINAFFELAIGTVLLAVPLHTVQQWTTAVLSWAQKLSPPGWASHYENAMNSVDASGVAFVAWYFLSHGVLKAFVIWCLVLKKLWAYPLGIVIFVGFGIYQTWEYFHSGGAFYLVLDVLDAALIGLTIMEWRHALKQRVP